MSDLSFPCIICGKTLEPVGEAPHQPYDGVMCQTAGNYGVAASLIHSMAQCSPSTSAMIALLNRVKRVEFL